MNNQKKAKNRPSHPTTHTHTHTHMGDSWPFSSVSVNPSNFLIQQIDLKHVKNYMRIKNPIMLQ